MPYRPDIYIYIIYYIWYICLNLQIGWVLQLHSCEGREPTLVAKNDKMWNDACKQAHSIVQFLCHFFQLLSTQFISIAPLTPLCMLPSTTDLCRLVFAFNFEHIFCLILFDSILKSLIEPFQFIGPTSCAFKNGPTFAKQRTEAPLAKCCIQNVEGMLGGHSPCIFWNIWPQLDEKQMW